MKRLALLLAVLSITLFAGCRTVAVIPVGTHTTVTHSQHIYPPLYPSHGYRHHYYGHELAYDSNFGAYLVLGFDDVYFYNNLYFRFYSGAWQTANRLDGRWHRAEHRHIPNRLRGHKRFKRHQRYSPPPHAPAHGHRHRHQHGVDLIFDSGIGAYIVLGFEDLFFFNNRYMRFYDGYWHHADRRDGRWRRAGDRHVPHKLRKARKRNNKNFFKKIKKQYRKEHREHREYRNKHDDRKHNRKHDKRRDRHDDGDNRKHNGKRDKKRDRHVDGDNQRKRKKNERDGSNYKDKEQRRDNGWLR